MVVEHGHFAVWPAPPQTRRLGAEHACNVRLEASQYLVDGRGFSQVAGQIGQSLSEVGLVFGAFSQETCFESRGRAASQEFQRLELDAVEAGAVEARPGQEQYHATIKALNRRDAGRGRTLVKGGTGVQPDGYLTVYAEYAA